MAATRVVETALKHCTAAKAATIEVLKSVDETTLRKLQEASVELASLLDGHHQEKALQIQATALRTL